MIREGERCPWPFLCERGARILMVYRISVHPPSLKGTLVQKLTTAITKTANLNLLTMNLVVAVHAAVGEDKTSSNKLVCTNHATPVQVRQGYVCAHCESPQIGKARMVDGVMVTIPADVMAAEKEADSVYKGSIALTVHPAGEVSSVLMPSGKSYYLAMDDETMTRGARFTYTLLSRLVSRRTDLAFMTKMALRSAPSLFQLTVAGSGVLVLRQMAEAELVREQPVIGFTEMTEEALAFADQLADAEVTAFVGSEHGTGRSQIVATFAAAQAPVQAERSALGDISDVADFTAHLAAKLKAAQSAKAPVVPAARKRATAKVVAGETKVAARSVKPVPAPAAKKSPAPRRVRKSAVAKVS